MEAKDTDPKNIDTKQLTLLFVEDDPNAVNSISTMLEKIFKKVYYASNGQEGCERFIEHKDSIDVIVTDIRMPKLNGTEMIMEIRKERSNVPVLVTTAFSDKDYLMRSIELGVNGYLVKPFKIMDLIEKIREAYYPVMQDKKLHEQYELTKNILDAQDNFTLLMDEKYDIKMANRTMLDFFGLDLLEQFLNRYDSIADLFIQEDGFLQKNHDNKNWFDTILNQKNNIHKVKLLSLEKKESIFYITQKKITYHNETHYVVIFNDITELENITQKKIIQEKHIAEHAKMAQMGSMIGSIAHQWRQPLSVISSISSGIKLKNTLGSLSDEQIDEYMDKLMETTSYLSDTITTFRNFLKEKKEYKEVCIQDRIDIALNIVKLTLDENNIKLKRSIDYEQPLIVKIVTGELVEVIINIMNNAKDVLCEKDKEQNDPWVHIELTKEEENAVISIEDNGGGIPADIKDKIFDEYFTTKDEEIGTGLGLYMSKQVIQESLGGKLSVQNTSTGAKFTIKLPLSKTC